MGYTINIDIDVIKRFINALKPEARIRVFQYLEEDLWKSRIRSVVTKMRKHVKKSGITDIEIDRICKEARKKHYGKS